MTDAEAAAGLKAVRGAWSEPMTKVQMGQYFRLFRGFQTETLKSALDDLIANGGPRPDPAEMGGLLRSKAGLRPSGQRVGGQRPGPFLTDLGFIGGDEELAKDPEWLAGMALVREALKEGQRLYPILRVERLARLGGEAPISPQEATNRADGATPPVHGSEFLNGKVDAGVGNADPF